MSVPDQPRPWLDFLNGAMLALLMQGLMLPLAFLSLFVLGSLSPLAGIGLLYLPGYLWGVSQLIYIVPVILYARSKGQVAYASGICLGATIVCVLHWAYMIQQQYVRWE